jgi:hypothetical protein
MRLEGCGEDLFEIHKSLTLNIAANLKLKVKSLSLTIYAQKRIFKKLSADGVRDWFIKLVSSEATFGCLAATFFFSDKSLERSNNSNFGFSSVFVL